MYEELKYSPFYPSYHCYFQWHALQDPFEVLFLAKCCNKIDFQFKILLNLLNIILSIWLQNIHNIHTLHYPSDTYFHVQSYGFICLQANNYRTVQEIFEYAVRLGQKHLRTCLGYFAWNNHTLAFLWIVEFQE